MTAQHTEHPEPYDYPELLANLRGEIVRRGLPMQRVAEMSGISQPSFSRRMNGADFTVRELLTVCNVLGVTLDDLTRPLPAQQRATGTGSQPGSASDNLGVTGRSRSVTAAGNVIPFPSRLIEAVEQDALAPVIQLQPRRARRAAA